MPEPLKKCPRCGELVTHDPKSEHMPWACTVCPWWGKSPEAVAEPADQRDEMIATLTVQVNQLQRDLTTERRRTRREKPDEERWWEVFVASIGGNEDPYNAGHIADAAMEVYDKHREPPSSEATTPDESDPEDRPAGGDADGPEGGAPAG